MPIIKIKSEALCFSLVKFSEKISCNRVYLKNDRIKIKEKIVIKAKNILLILELFKKLLLRIFPIKKVKHDMAKIKKSANKSNLGNANNIKTLLLRIKIFCRF